MATEPTCLATWYFPREMLQSWAGLRHADAPAITATHTVSAPVPTTPWGQTNPFCRLPAKGSALHVTSAQCALGDGANGLHSHCCPKTRVSSPGPT